MQERKIYEVELHGNCGVMKTVISAKSKEEVVNRFGRMNRVVRICDVSEKVRFSITEMEGCLREIGFSEEKIQVIIYFLTELQSTQP